MGAPVLDANAMAFVPDKVFGRMEYNMHLDREAVLRDLRANAAVCPFSTFWRDGHVSGLMVYAETEMLREADMKGSDIGVSFCLYAPKSWSTEEMKLLKIRTGTMPYVVENEGIGVKPLAIEGEIQVDWNTTEKLRRVHRAMRNLLKNGAPDGI